MKSGITNKLAESSVSLMLCLVGLALNYFSLYSLSYAAILFAFFVQLKFVDFKNIGHLMWASGVSAFIMAPATLELIYLRTHSAYVTAIAVMASSLWYWLCPRVSHNFVGKFGKPRQQVIFWIIYAACVVLLILTEGDSYKFTWVGLFLVGLLCLSRKKTIFDMLIFLMIGSYVIYYMFSYWWGFGRLTILTPIVLIYIYGTYYFKIPFNIYIFNTAMIFGGMVSSFLRFGFDRPVISMVLNDSIFRPFYRAKELITADFISDVGGLLDQYMLLFLSVVPREIWQNKPLGFGKIYVEEQLSGVGYSDIFSIAALFLGEHFYYIGVAGLVTIVITLFLICLIIKILSSQNLMYGILALVPIYWIHTFIWGGMASFSARVETSLLAVPVFLLILVVLNKLFGTKSK